MSDQKIYTLFMDMHSGGQTKVKNSETDVEYIIIEGDEGNAILTFQHTFGRHPFNITCSCCGEDYVTRTGLLDQITAWHRNCDYDETARRYVEMPRFEGAKVVSLKKFLAGKNVKLVQK